MTTGTIPSNLSHFRDRPQDRNWRRRWFEISVYLVLSIIMPPVLGGLFLWLWTNTTLGITLGAYLAISASLLWLERTAWWFLIRVRAGRLFVTLDEFRGQYVVYGPGLHASLLYEKREADGNISLEEVAESFQFDLPIAEIGRAHV